MGLVDLLTGQHLLEILDQEVARLADKQAKGVLNGGEIAILEKLARTYHILKTEDREAEKGLGRLNEEELKQLMEEEEETTSTAD